MTVEQGSIWEDVDPESCCECGEHKVVIIDCEKWHSLLKEYDVVCKCHNCDIKYIYSRQAFVEIMKQVN